MVRIDNLDALVHLAHALVFAVLLAFVRRVGKQRGAADGISPGGSAFSSLLGSAGSVAGSWYSLNKSGALKGTMFELG